MPETGINKMYLKIDKLNEQARLEIHRNPDASLKLAEEVIANSTSIGYLKGIADGKFTKGSVLILRNMSEEASKFLEYSIEIYRGINDQTTANGWLQPI